MGVVTRIFPTWSFLRVALTVSSFTVEIHCSQGDFEGKEYNSRIVRDQVDNR